MLYFSHINVVFPAPARIYIRKKAYSTLRFQVCIILMPLSHKMELDSEEIQFRYTLLWVNQMPVPLALSFLTFSRAWLGSTGQSHSLTF